VVLFGLIRFLRAFLSPQYLFNDLVFEAGLLIVAFLVCAYAADWVYLMHSKSYPIPRGTFNIVIYSFIGAFKIFFLMFNLVPYVALLILG
jgi:hypothetical protein